MSTFSLTSDPTPAAQGPNQDSFAFPEPLMMFAQPRLTTLAQVETVLGQHLIRMEVLRIQIETIRHTVDRERWQERLAALAVFALIGAVIGCVTLFSAVGK